MRWKMILAMGIGLTCTTPMLEAAEAGECGLEPEVVPDLGLVDINPRSASNGQTIHIGDLQGQVVVLYFAHATCGVCQSHVLALQEMWADRGPEWPDVSLLVINGANLDEHIDSLVQDQVDLPILQDTTEAGIYPAYGASKWYTYLIDKQGYPKIIHYKLNFPGEAVRLAAEIDGLREGAP